MTEKMTKPRAESLQLLILGNPDFSGSWNLRVGTYVGTKDRYLGFS
jgi:hypothetical protein